MDSRTKSKNIFYLIEIKWKYAEYPTDFKNIYNEKKHWKIANYA